MHDDKARGETAALEAEKQGLNAGSDTGELRVGQKLD